MRTLRAEFETLSMKENEKIDDFCKKLYGVVTNIRTLGDKMEETYVVKKLLRVVPSKYVHIASTIEQFGNLEEMTVEEVVGRLKAHEERIHGKTEDSSGTGNQLLLTEDEWKKREAIDGKLLLTREEWLRKSGKGGTEGSLTHKNRSSDYRGRAGQDKSKVRCINCLTLGHYAAKCRKPKRNKEQRQESNLAHVVEDDERALLLTESG